MKTTPLLSANVLVSAGAMALAWLAVRWALAALVGEGGFATASAILAASIAGAFALSRTGPHGSWAPIAKLVSAVEAMRRGDLTARAPVPERNALSPLAHALNDLAGTMAASAEATKKELELLSSILDGMAEGVIVFDRAGHIVLANLAARRMAVSSDDVVGKSAIEALRNASLAGAVRLALEKGESVVREVELGGPLPRRLIVRVSERADKAGRGGVIAVLHDVTDRRRLETIRTEFVSNVSHELRTPVTAIATAAETLLGGALDDRADAGEFVEIIERNARRLRRLVEDLLDLSKIEGKAYKLSPREEALEPLFVNTQKLVLDAANRRGIRVIIAAEADVSAWIDRHALEQVLANLLDNAIKYAGERSAVTLRAQNQGDRAVVTVSDSGAGIPPQHLERLFERFYRVDAGRSREVGGTGLGLAIVKHLVEAMGGAVAVQSELGHGTTFTIDLPRIPPSPSQPGEAPPADS
jgi:two-component system phosphate regulon sensor histidine kinase PhoR